MSSTMEMLLIVWGVLTALLLVLLIYRSTLSMHEEDQLYLSEAEAHMQREQDEAHARMNKTIWPMRVLGGASGALILLIAGLYVYQGFLNTRLP
jgi:predicted RND superfamily exporter protein